MSCRTYSMSAGASSAGSVSIPLRRTVAGIRRRKSPRPQPMSRIAEGRSPMTRGSAASNRAPAVRSRGGPA